MSSWPTYGAWPKKSDVTKVEKRFNDPGYIIGNPRISMVEKVGEKTFNGAVIIYGVNVATTFTYNNANMSVKELVFSGKYGLMPVGLGTNQYVIKRLYSVVLNNATSPSTTLPKLFYNTPDINVSLGTGWKWYLTSRSRYTAVSVDVMNAFFLGSEDKRMDNAAFNPDSKSTDLTMKTGVDLTGIINAVAATLLAAGHSQKEIDKYLGINREVKKPGNKVTTKDENKTESVKFVDYGEPTISIKTSIGYVKVNPTSSANDNRPYMIQKYKVGEETKTNKFYFTYIPQTISYTPGGSQWNEIPRSTDAPLAEWSEWSLTKVQMTFLIAGKRTENAGTASATKVPDGLDIDIENQLLKLRKMATVPYPVSIFNLDTIFNLQLRQARIKRVASEWAITDLTIKSKRRTSGSPSKISVAEISLSLTEYPIERQELYNLPRFKIPNIPAPKKPGTGGGNNRPELLTQIMTPSVWGALET